MYSNTIVNGRCSRLPILLRSLATLHGQKLAEIGKSIDGITPPQRIPRSPTDILQALAFTVGPDPTAAHYKYHDDPFLIPYSNFQKRSYALAAESGRKAAAWIRDQHPELFTTRQLDPPMKKTVPYYNADPKIDIIAPKPIYNENSKVTEEDLVYTIQNAQLDDAIQIYRLLREKIDLSEELKLSFLQFLCFYNEDQPMSAEYLDQNWFTKEQSQRNIITWRSGGLADKIFESMKPKTSEAYCAIIQGKAKYHQGEEAWALAREAAQQGFCLSTEVFNGIVSCVGYFKESTKLRIETLMNILEDMNNQGLTPNAGTLSACLKTMSTWGGGQGVRDFTLDVIAEFKRLDVQFSLSAYDHLLNIFCKPNGPGINIMTTILNELELRDTLEVTDVADTNFFVTAMIVCNEHLQDFELAERLHALLLKGDNYKLLGDSFDESRYYRHYVSVACKKAPFENAMRLIDSLIPHVYVPEMSIMFMIIQTLEEQNAGARLAAAWKQFVMFGFESQTNLVNRLLEAFTHCYCGEGENVKADIRSVAGEIIKVYEMVDEREQEETSRKTNRIPQLAATALATIVEMCCDTQDKLDRSWEVAERAIKRLLNGQAVGVPVSMDGLAEAAPKAALAGRPNLAAMIVTYMADGGFHEAIAASEKTLGVMLNRSPEEVKELLSKPAAEVINELHHTEAEVFKAYKMATEEQESRVPEEEFTSRQLPSEFNKQQ